CPDLLRGWSPAESAAENPSGSKSRYPYARTVSAAGASRTGSGDYLPPAPPTTAGRRPGRGRADRRGLRGLQGLGRRQVDRPVGLRAQVGVAQEFLPVRRFPVPNGVRPVLDLAVLVPAVLQGLRQLLELYGRRLVVPAVVGEQDDL